MDWTKKPRFDIFDGSYGENPLLAGLAKETEFFPFAQATDGFGASSLKVEAAVPMRYNNAG